MQVKSNDADIILARDGAQLRVPVQEFIDSILRLREGITPLTTLEINTDVKTAVLEALKNGAVARRHRQEELKRELTRLQQCDR